MQKKHSLLSIFCFFTITVFSQQSFEAHSIEGNPVPLTYLDSIKQSFVRYKSMQQMDSMWTKEINDLSIYNDLTSDIENINSLEKIDSELPTEVLKERLAAMDAKSPFKIEYNQVLENLIKSFLKNRKKAFGRLMATSEYYFPMFEEALAKKNVPLEIKYLAIVESALNPKAVSRVGATGIWQFMYNTGKQYNLHIDSYVDERSDVLKSSEAAAQYMANMYPIFQDWELVLASYNSGPGNVTKAIRRSGGKQNFWEIKNYLPKETQGYVPAFLATMYLYEYHKEHGIIPERANLKHFETDTIRIQKEITFKQIADLIDVPESQLKALNPSYKRNVIPVYNDKHHYLRLPLDKVGLFASNEDKIYAYVAHDNAIPSVYKNTATAIASKKLTKDSAAVASNTEEYTIQKGDNLHAVARTYNVTVEELKNWNGLTSNTIALGKVLKIKSPIEKANKALAIASKSAVASTITTSVNKDQVQDSLAALTSSQKYLVQKGDNIQNIAKKYHLTVEELEELNPTLSELVPGTTIVLNVNNAVAVQDTPKPQLKDITYTVVAGDNLGAIAKKFGTPVADILAWNRISKNKLPVGTQLIVAKNEIAIITNNATVSSFKKQSLYPSAKSKSETHDYFVKKGDSLYSISKKYPGVTIADLEKWNGIKAEDLKPGMKLKING